MTGGDILWATRRGFWENLERHGFPGSQGLESSGKVLTEATKVVETGSQGGVKGVKVLFFLQPSAGCIVTSDKPVKR